MFYKNRNKYIIHFNKNLVDYIVCFIRSKRNNNSSETVIKISFLTRRKGVGEKMAEGM